MPISLAAESSGAVSVGSPSLRPGGEHKEAAAARLRMGRSSLLKGRDQSVARKDTEHFIVRQLNRLPGSIVEGIENPKHIPGAAHDDNCMTVGFLPTRARTIIKQAGMQELPKDCGQWNIRSGRSGRTFTRGPRRT